MSPFFRLLSEFFWLVALGFGAFNYWAAHRKLAAAEDPASQDGEGIAYLRRFTIGANLPWAVMGAGQLLGYTPTVWYYFRPQDSNPFVLAWLATVLAVTCVYAWWVLFAGGAQKVRDLNLMAALGQRSSKPPSIASIKLFAAFGPLFFPVWIYLVASMNAQLPK